MIIPLYEPKELPNLVWLGFAAHFLNIDQFADFSLDVNVVATPPSRQSKAERLHEVDEVGEADVLNGALGQPPQELPSVHCRAESYQALGYWMTKRYANLLAITARHSIRPERHAPQRSRRERRALGA